MALVYRAWDGRLQVWRAIKVLGHVGSRNTALRQRFEQEARTMARLRHRHVLAVHDIVTSGDRPFMVMDLAVTSLQDHVAASGPLSPRRAALVVIDVLDALQLAHAEGVVHRDLKPANLLVGHDGSVLLADFGIAHLSLGLTRDGATIGTLGFMPPEQQGSASTVDGRADLYAVGATLFALCTGAEPPRCEAPAPDRVPEALREPIERAMACDPGDRYPSADAMRAALLAVVDRLPTDPADAPEWSPVPSSRPPPPTAASTHALDPPSQPGVTWAEAPAPPRRSRRAPVVVASVGVLAALALGALAWLLSADRGGGWGEPRRMTHLPPEMEVKDVAFEADGRIVYLTQEGLFRLDPGSPGGPEPVLAITDVESFSTFPDGADFLLELERPRGVFRRVGPDGSPRGLELEGSLPAVSPDGRSIAWVSADRDVWVGPTAGGRPRRVRIGGGSFLNAISWSPSSDELAAVVADGDTPHIARFSTEGGASVDLPPDRRWWLPNGTGWVTWPDAEHLVAARRADAGVELVEMRLDGSDDHVLAVVPTDGLMDLVSDPDHVVALGSDTLSDLWLLDVGPDGATGEPERLTWDERKEEALGWTGDGRFVYAYPNGSRFDIVVHRPGERTGRTVLSGSAGDVAVAGDVVRSFGEPGSRPQAFPLDGPRSLAPPGSASRSIQCSADGGVCVELSSAPGDHLEWLRVDPVSGEQVRFATLPWPGQYHHWSLSRDGRTVLFVNVGRPPVSVSVETGVVSPVDLPASAQFASERTDRPGWWFTPAADDAGSRLETVTDGPVPDPSMRAPWLAQPHPSPDGGKLVVMAWQFDTDVWWIERS